MNLAWILSPRLQASNSHLPKGDPALASSQKARSQHSSLFCLLLGLRSPPPPSDPSLLGLNTNQILTDTLELPLTPESSYWQDPGLALIPSQPGLNYPTSKLT